MAALMKAHRDPEIDISTEIMGCLMEVTQNNFGPFEPSDWLCINLNDYRVGRAYPYKGEYRIVPMVADMGLLQRIDEAVNSDEGQAV